VSRKKKEKAKPPGPFDALRALKEELQKRDQPTPGKKAAPPIPTARPIPVRDPVEDEALLFHRLFAGVQPLDRSRARLPRQSVERSPRAEQLAREAGEAARLDASAVHDHLRVLVEGRTRFEVEDDGNRVEGRRVDLPMDTLRRLRRGALPVDARLDLHGMSVQQARVQLELFLRTTRSRGERCVLVIHGKGDHSPRGTGALRGEISAWLSQSASSEHVAAFATARAADGGEGAVYVLLRRS
jgi:DNA-nicking Smr family endonuclease